MVIKIAKVTIFHLGIFKFPILLIENKQKNNIPRNIEAFKSSSEKYIKIMNLVRIRFYQKLMKNKNVLLRMFLVSNILQNLQLDIQKQNLLKN